ncbi:putative membrane protein [Candidatus Phytoplasma solani]|uniref:hypothetical protein n=1 Tax=Candidatus Phytoplasma solani TaxID=69896 RepID=UPI0032DA255C
MQKEKQYSNWFFYLISIIISLIGIIMSFGITFYYMNHNSLKEHINSKSEYLKDNINSKSEHLKENINQVEKKVDEFKQETQINFNKLDKKIDKLTEKNYEYERK